MRPVLVAGTMSLRVKVFITMSALEGADLGNLDMAVIIIGEKAHEVPTEDVFPRVSVGLHEHDPRLQVDPGIRHAGQFGLSFPQPTQIGQHEIRPTPTYMSEMLPKTVKGFKPAVCLAQEEPYALQRNKTGQQGKVVLLC